MKTKTNLQINDVTEYNQDLFLTPLWRGDRVYAEPVFVLKNYFNNIRPSRLAYPIKKILAVRSYDLQTLYTEGKDYVVNEYGELQVLDNGAIPRLLWKDFRKSEKPSGECYMDAADALGSYFFCDMFSDKKGMSEYMVTVTYTHEPNDYYNVTPSKSQRVETFLNKLKSGKKCKVVSYGDSITYGWGASGMQDIKRLPLVPKYCDQVVNYLSEKFNCEIEHKNFAVGGKCSDWGAQDEIVAQAINEHPDFVILSFGMNDAGVIRPEIFVQYMQSIIDKMRKGNEELCFVIVSPIMPNPLVGFAAGSSILTYHYEYHRAFEQLEKQNEKVAYANLTKLHQMLLERKTLQDTLSNNVNHPNDFMHRVQAQVVLKTILGDLFDKD